MARSATQYLKRRKQTWYVQLAVPRAAQQALGTKVLVRSLGTRDLAEANRIKHGVLAVLQRLIAQSEPGRPAAQDATAAALLRSAEEHRAAIEAGEETEEDADAAFDVEVDRLFDSMGRDSAGDPRLSEEEATKVRRAYKALRGRLKYTLGKLAEQYLEESAPSLTAQSIDEKRRHLSAFAAWFGPDREAPEVTRRVAGRYVAEQIQKRTKRATEGEPAALLSAVTRRKEVSALRSFFDWLAARGLIEANPFDRMAATVKASTRGAKPKRRPWSPAELSTVLRGVDPNDPLWALTAIAAYTGMRREEVGELKVSAVDGGMLRVEEGKTAAAVRRVPIHPTLGPLIKRLAETSPDGFLIPGLLRGGPDQKRAWYLGKRFGRAIRKLGIDDPTLDFHALRGTVITQLEGAGIPESTIQLIVGHKRQGMTFGVYSGGVPDKVKRDALRHLSYGARLDDFVSATGARVSVRASAASRKA